MLVPLIFIFFGVYWLGTEAGWFPWLESNMLWPIVLIMIGVLMLLKHTGRGKKR